jgi:tRNA pseudouridine55 synthase
LHGKSQSARDARALTGLVLVDKAVGPSSFDVVKRLRQRYGVRAGHAGTLDPRASGLLLCLLGSSTRLARYLVGLDKRYETEIRLGLRTTTGDGEGEPLEETEIVLRERIEALEGEVELPVPQASAVKIEGERAYRLFRKGTTVEMPMRQSTIHSLRVRRYAPPLVELDLHVSSGTYVRSLADALGGHCRTIRRTAVGPFCVEDADEEVVLPPLAALVTLPERELNEDEARTVRHGRPVPGSEEGPVALHLDGHLVAVAQGDGRELRPETVLPPT